MIGLNYINERVFLPLSDLLTGKSIRKSLDFLNVSQFWKREQIEEYQNHKLRELVHHSYSNVPLYHALFSDLRLKPYDIQTKEDLKKLPVLTKEYLRKNKTKHIAGNIRKKEIIHASSSGSTGEPFQYYKSHHSESFQKACAIRGWNWMGYRLGDPYIKLSMNPRSSVIKKIQDYVNNSLYLSSNQLIKEEFDRIALLIDRFNPKFIRGYPVPLLLLAQQYEKEDVRYPGKILRAINATGSTLHQTIRQKIENVFGVKVFDSYSCEGGAIFFECPSHDCYHPSEEYAIQEFLEDGFTSSNPQHPVRHITTDLHNYASPFIRYDTGDYVVLGKNEECSCGRHFRNISKILGRESDVLVTPTGKYLIVENFVAYFEWIEEVDQVQVVQEEVDQIVINLVVNDNFNSEVLRKIKEYWCSYIGNDVNLSIEIKNQIDLTPTGKRRTLIRRSHIKLDERY